MPVAQRRILASSGSGQLPTQSGFSICVSYTLRAAGRFLHLNEQQDFSGGCPQSSEMVSGMQDYFAKNCPSGSMCHNAKVVPGACASIGNDVCYVTKESDRKYFESMIPEGCCASVKMANPEAGEKTCPQLAPQLTDKDSPFCGAATPHVTAQPERAHKEQEDFTPMLVTTFALYALTMGLIVLFFCTGGFACFKIDDYDSDDESITDTEMAEKNHKQAIDDFAFRRMSLTGASELMLDRMKY